MCEIHGFYDDSSVPRAQRALKLWILQAPEHDSRESHMGQFTMSDVPSDAELDAMLLGY